MPKLKKVKPAEKPLDGNLEELIIQSLMEKKGEGIVCLNLKKINHVFFDYFIICTGNSKTHVETLSDFVQFNVRKLAGINPSFVEGRENGEWILMDYFNIVVHILQPETRKFYNIEQLWSDAPIQQF